MTRRRIIGSLTALLFSSDPAFAAHPLRFDRHDRYALARTLWGEGRGEPLIGQLAICDVVFNRVLSSDSRFDRDTSVYVTCHRRDQFSCFTQEHPESLSRNSPEYATLLNTVDLAYYRYLHHRDYSRDATFYCTRHVHPQWLREVRHTVTIGKHRFFKLR